MTSLYQRNIRITIDLNTPAQDANGATTQQQDQLSNQQVVIVGTGTGQDFTIRATISKIIGQARNSADVTIYGLSHDLIAVLSHINFYPIQVLYNKIKIEAGYDGNYSTYFIGNIVNSVPDYNDPSSPINIQALSGWYDAIQMASNTNTSGAIPLLQLIKNVAAKSSDGNLAVVANGIDNVTVQNAAYAGGVTEQLAKIASDYNLNMQYDDDKIKVSPVGQPLVTGTIPTISANNIMYGYPKPCNYGVDVRCMLNSQIQFGQTINIDSIVPLTSGNWIIIGAIYQLENRGQKYEILYKCNKFGFLYGGS